MQDCHTGGFFRHLCLFSHKTYFVDQKLPSAERSYLTRTLKEHLYQCPSRLSEELVRCMVAIYCCIGSKASAKTEKPRSPFLSRSSTSVILQGRGDGEPHEWLGQSALEVTSISMEKNHFSSASCAMSNYRLDCKHSCVFMSSFYSTQKWNFLTILSFHFRLLVEQLERVDANALENHVKLAFWINVYNCLIMHVNLVLTLS